MLALIAGTGFYDWEALQNQQEKHVQTPYGEAVLFVGEVATPDGSKPLVFLPRHARSHSIPPHLINYREHTFFEGGEAGVRHTDMTDCYAKDWQRQIKAAAERAGVPIVEDGVYVCVQGPRFESRAEIRAFARLGGTISGMTGVPEVTLANELGLQYGSLAMVTNFACGLAEKVTHEEVTELMGANAERLAKILLQLVYAYQEC